MPPRISSRVTVGANLIQLDVLQTCFFLKLSSGRGFQSLVLVDESSRKSPAALERVIAPLYQQDLNRFLLDLEQDRVDCNRRPRVFIAISARGCVRGLD